MNASAFSTQQNSNIKNKQKLVACKYIRKYSTVNSDLHWKIQSYSFRERWVEKTSKLIAILPLFTNQSSNSDAESKFHNGPKQMVHCKWRVINWPHNLKGSRWRISGHTQINITLWYFSCNTISFLGAKSIILKKFPKKKFHIKTFKKTWVNWIGKTRVWKPRWVRS